MTVPTGKYGTSTKTVKFKPPLKPVPPPPSEPGGTLGFYDDLLKSVLTAPPPVKQWPMLHTDMWVICTHVFRHESLAPGVVGTLVDVLYHTSSDGYLGWKEHATDTYQDLANERKEKYSFVSYKLWGPDVGLKTEAYHYETIQPQKLKDKVYLNGPKMNYKASV